jgi:outer membrane lipoprotein-sorting protein
VLKRLATILIVLVLVGCGGDDEDDGNELPGTAEPDQDPATILVNASTQIANIQSLRFTLEVTGTTNIDDTGTIQLLSARGTLKRPNLVDVQFQVRLLGAQTASIRMITVGDQSWTTDLISGNWGPAPKEFGYDPSRLFDTQDGLGPIMGKIANPELIGEEEVNGRAVWHIRGSVPQSVIGPITADTMRGDTIPFDIWIDRETNDPLRIQLAEPRDQGIDDPATWVMDLRDHDKPVTIEPPV